MKKAYISVLLASSLAIAGASFAADVIDDVTQGTNDVIEGGVQGSKEVGRDTGKVIESTGQMTKDVFE